MTQFTYDALVSQAKQSEAEYMGLYIPVITMFFGEFCDKANINDDVYPTLEIFLKNAQLDQTADQFKQMGFNVIACDPSFTNVLHTLTDHPATDSSLHKMFLDRETNVFIIDVTNGIKSLHLVLSYDDPTDPLVDHVVDWTQVEKDNARRERIKKLFR